MWVNEVTTDIAAPIEDVYRYLADFPRHKEWSLGVADVEPVNGDNVGVGAEFDTSETIPMKFASHTRIVALEPPRFLAWESTDGKFMRVAWSLDLSPIAGGTRLVERSQWQPRNLLGRAMLRLVRTRQIPNENRQSLERLKQTLEAMPATHRGCGSDALHIQPAAIGG